MKVNKWDWTTPAVVDNGCVASSIGGEKLSREVTVYRNGVNTGEVE